MAPWRRRRPSSHAPSAATRPAAGSASARAAAASARSSRRRPRRRRRRPQRPGRCFASPTSQVEEADRIVDGRARARPGPRRRARPASLVLVGGEPGVGKSTLLLVALATSRASRRALLVTGEESAAQVKLRAERLGGTERVEILAETDARRDLRDARARAAGRLRDRLCADALLGRRRLRARLGRAGARGGGAADARREDLGVALFLVGHVTKDGAVAGPRVLEHLVDCVLHFEGDRYRAHRVLRAAKNRFGSTNELGVFEMTGTGLRRRARPVRALRSHVAGRDRRGRRLRRSRGRGRCCSRSRRSSRRPTSPCPAVSRTGVDPKRLAMIVAVLGRHARLALGSADVFVNVAGGVRIDEPGADLADRARHRLGGARGACAGCDRRVRRDRPHRAPAPGDAGRAAARRVREARPDNRCRAVWHRRGGLGTRPASRDGAARRSLRPSSGRARTRPEQGFCVFGRENPWKPWHFRHAFAILPWLAGGAVSAGFLGELSTTREVGLVRGRREGGLSASRRRHDRQKGEARASWARSAST